MKPRHVALFVVGLALILLPCFVDTGPMYPPLIPRKDTMTETMKPPATKSQPKPMEDGLRVRTLMFNAQGGIDLPNEQRQARLQTAIVRPDKPRYEVMYVPRLGGYLVREFASWKEGDKLNTPKGEMKCEFLIPREWALAEFEAL